MRWFAFVPIIILCSCKKSATDSDITLPPSFNFNVNATPSMPCTGTGTVTINDLNGNYTYKIDNGIYQPSPVFINIKVGSHLVTVRAANNKEQNKEIIVDTVPNGVLFKTVQQLLVAKCTPCHMGVNPQSGLDWNNVCDVVNSWDRIRERAVFGNPSPMPQPGLLPQTERNKIIDWINAGHGYTN
jgi:hypothetical protein